MVSSAGNGMYYTKSPFLIGLYQVTCYRKSLKTKNISLDIKLKVTRRQSVLLRYHQHDEDCLCSNSHIFARKI